MNNEAYDDYEPLETEGFLHKSDKRKQRLERSSKARLHRERRKQKEERAYEDGFYGNYAN